MEKTNLSCFSIEPLAREHLAQKRREKGKKNILETFNDVPIQYLKEAEFEALRPGQKIGPLSYKQIQKYFNNGQDHKYSMSISKIIYVQRAADGNNFSSMSSSHNHSMYLWHGTLSKNIPHILHEGFKITPIPTTPTTRLLGHGIYFADRASKSGLYSKASGERPKMGFLLLCEVFLGKRYTANDPQNNRKSPPEGYDSVQSIGTHIPDSNGEENINGISLPSGKSVANMWQDPLHLAKGKLLTFNEYVVYSPEKIRIRYLVHFKFKYST